MHSATFQHTSIGTAKGPDVIVIARIISYSRLRYDEFMISHTRAATVHPFPTNAIDSNLSGAMLNEIPNR